MMPDFGPVVALAMIGLVAIVAGIVFGAISLVAWIF